MPFHAKNVSFCTLSLKYSDKKIMLCKLWGKVTSVFVYNNSGRKKSQFWEKK